MAMHPNKKRKFVAKDNFIVWIPTGRAINPKSETNWEGKGVEPNIKTQSEEALETAYKMALEKLEAE